jgi:hypothetical protein
MLKHICFVLLSNIVLFCLSTIPVFAGEYNISAPDDISLGDFDSVTNYPKTNLTITATTTDNSTSVDIVVKDAKTNKAGYLTLNGIDSSGSTELTNKLQVKGGPDQLSYVDLTGGSGITLASAETLMGGEYSFNDFAVRQTIAAADLEKTPGSYSLILTFTATFY